VVVVAGLAMQSATQAAVEMARSMAAAAAAVDVAGGFQGLLGRPTLAARAETEGKGLSS